MGNDKGITIMGSAGKGKPRAPELRDTITQLYLFVKDKNNFSSDEIKLIQKGLNKALLEITLVQ